MSHYPTEIHTTWHKWHIVS